MGHLMVADGRRSQFGWGGLSSLNVSLPRPPIFESLRKLDNMVQF